MLIGCSCGFRSSMLAVIIYWIILMKTKRIPMRGIMLILMWKWMMPSLWRTLKGVLFIWFLSRSGDYLYQYHVF